MNDDSCKVEQVRSRQSLIYVKLTYVLDLMRMIDSNSPCCFKLGYFMAHNQSSMNNVNNICPH